MAFIPAIAIPHTIERSGATPARRTSSLRGLRMTFAGLLTILVVVMVAAAALTSESNLLLLLFGIAAGLLTFNAVACMRSVRRIDVDRTIGSSAVAGHPFRIIYTIRSRRRWLRSWSIEIGEAPLGRHGPVFPHGFVPVLQPEGEEQIELLAVHPWRGRIHLRGVRVSSGFPFGLFTCSVDIEAPVQLVVYPSVGRARRELWRQPAAAEALARRRAEKAVGEEEFHGLREYRSGDDPRWIHWKRSARTGQLVVREHLPIRESQIIVLLDPWPEPPDPQSIPRRIIGSVLSGASQAYRDPRAERVITAAATAVCDAVDHGHRVGLICRAAVPIIMAPAGGRAHRQRMLEELALLAPNPAGSIHELAAGIRWSSGWNARCLLFTTHPQEAHHHALRMLTRRAESVSLLSLDSGALDRLFDLGAAGKEERTTA
jgi:uncharacterized protein (DUF58 family)